MQSKYLKMWTIPVPSYFHWILFFAMVFLVFKGPVSMAAVENPDTDQELALSLNDSISQALHNNIMIRLAHERIEEKKGLRMISGSDLRPHLTLDASQNRIYWYNLAVDGLPESGTMGPFNSYGAEIQLVQRIFDLNALAGFQAQEKELKISEIEEELVKQQVIFSAVFSYLNILDSEEKLRAVDEDLKLAQQLVTMAEHHFSAGVVTEIDVIRAKTRLAEQQAHRQDILQSRHTAYFHLKRVMGLSLATTIRLTDSLQFFNEPFLSLKDAMNQAFNDRIEMSLSMEKVQYQEKKLSQAKKEHLPVVEFYSNYGHSGVTPEEYMHETGSLGVKLTMPIFEGGKITGHIRQQESLKKAEEIKRDDVQIQVEEDVRLAIQTLLTGIDKVEAQEKAFNLAKREVELAQNQYHAGMENNIAVVQAQTTMERAHESYITSLIQYHMARINYYSALGNVESFHLNPSENESVKNDF